MLCIFAAVVVPVAAEKGVVSARVAAARLPIPSFKELHRQYVRLVRNESGWKSYADKNGILRSMLHSGGGRVRRPDRRGMGYGLDYSRLMARMVRHSSRTFPRRSRFLAILSPARLAHISRLRTYNNEWISGLQLDCSQPSGWNEDRSGSWLGYVKRCAELVRVTGDFLRGKMPNHCESQPTTWGSESDARRKNGPLAKGWKEIACDWPAEIHIELEGIGTITSCPDLREAAWEHKGAAKLALNNSYECARNRFFDWRVIDGKRAPMAMR